MNCTGYRIAVQVVRKGVLNIFKSRVSESI